jgi:riboflavin synthase
MFTGIVERTGEVRRVEDRAGSRLLTVLALEPSGLPPWRPVAPGESVALNGVCLTAILSRMLPGGGEVSFEAVPETLERTTLGELRPGDPVNLERSLAVGGTFGGHYVQGHVDGVGLVHTRRPEGDQVLFEVTVERVLLRQVIRKGSVAVDGVSLTVIDVSRDEGWFSFAAIPHTLERTTLSRREPGSRVNIETDAFGKWVLHGLAEILGRGERLGDVPS